MRRSTRCSAPRSPRCAWKSFARTRLRSNSSQWGCLRYARCHRGTPRTSTSSSGTTLDGVSTGLGTGSGGSARRLSRSRRRGPKASLPAAVRTKRRWDPHLEPGTLQGSFPPIQEVAELLVGVRSVEQEALDHEVDRLLVAELRAQILRREREASTQLLNVALESLHSLAHPTTLEELEQTIQRPENHREAKGEHGGE